MEGNVRVCPKCGGEMEEGHVWGNHGGDGMRWIKKGVSFSERFATAFKKQNVHSFSCVKCGYIERYRDIEEEGAASAKESSWASW